MPGKGQSWPGHSQRPFHHGLRGNDYFTDWSEIHGDRGFGRRPLRSCAGMARYRGEKRGW